MPSPALLAFDEVKFLAEVTPQDEEILYRIDVRKHNREQKLLLAEGRVVAGGTERATVWSSCDIASHATERIWANRAASVRP